MRYGLSKAMLDEVKGRLERTVHQKLEAFDDANPEPEIPERIQRRIEAQRNEWRKKRERYKDQIRKARDKFFDRIVFDHENAMLLLRDFDKWKP
jgi:hypothetical protein